MSTVSKQQSTENPNSTSVVERRVRPILGTCDSRHIAASETLTTRDLKKILFVDLSGGDVTLTLPSVNDSGGHSIYINIKGQAGSGSENDLVISGVTNFSGATPAAGKTFQLHSDGYTWFSM